MKIHFKSISMFITIFLTILLTINLFSINLLAATLTENNGLKYIEQENGDMNLYTGWIRKTRSDKHFYYKNGKLLKNCWLTKKGDRQYYLTSDGSLCDR